MVEQRRGERLADLVAATPPSRERYVDFLRAASILTVVVGHWWSGLVFWDDGVLGTTSAIGVTPWLWLATWVFQVMPLFFFVGGFSNLVAHDATVRRGHGSWTFLRARLARLLRPSLVFVGVWVLLQALAHLLDVGAPTAWGLRGVEPPGATVPFGPLWFLAVYVAVVATSPLTLRLHRRFGAAVPIVMAIAIVLADVVGFVGGVHEVRWVNAALVWLLPHQLGYFYADGRLAALGPRRLAVLALTGLGLLVVLTNPVFGDAGQTWFPGIGHYPKSLLGTDLEPITNTLPPTLCMAAMGLWSIGVAMLLRDRVSRWLTRRRPWTAVVFVNGIIMTLYLWHMTAFLLAVAVLWPLGFGRQTDTTVGWWWERPLWLLVPALFLSVIVALFRRFERPARAPTDRLDPA